MGSVYLDPGEYAAFGLPGSTSVADVADASTLIDALVHRPEGMVWKPDGNGAPAYMAALDPQLVFTAAGGIPIGASVAVAVSGGMLHQDLVGEVFIVDRTDPAKAEALVVSAVGPATITFEAVTIAHTGSVTLESGLTILEERSLPGGRSVTRVARSPVVRMVAILGRYGYGRRSQQRAGVFAVPTMLDSVQLFGGVPKWNAIRVSDVSVSPATGEVWVPTGGLAAPYSDVRMRFIAGWQAAHLPYPIKAACAGVVSQLQQFPELMGSIKSFQAGGTKIERFADSLLDETTRGALSHFAARIYA